MDTNQRTVVLNAEAQLDDCLGFFDEWVTPKELETIRGNCLRAIGNKGRQIARKRYALLIGKSGDTLQRSIKARTSRNKMFEIIEAKARVEENPLWAQFKHKHDDIKYVYYGYKVAQGGLIRPRDPEDYLTFRINGKWVKVKEVWPISQDFLSGPIENWMITSEPSTIMKQQIDKELIKLAKKYGVEVV